MALEIKNAALCGLSVVIRKIYHLSITIRPIREIVLDLPR